MSAALFEPLQLGAITVPNRIFMAPLTRIRATREHVPTELMATYYAQRASAGLIIAECTMIAPKQSAFLTEPGIYSEEQIAAWKLTTDAVHAKGGRIILQIWHGGRAAVPMNSDGEQNVSASALKISTHVGAEFNPTGEKIDNALPRALTDEEIKGVVAQFAQAAKNAIAAGFDGVEIHGANGYLIDQFMRTSSNTREGPYGGSVENRLRFLFEVVEATGKAIGFDRVGLRISPINSYNDMKDQDPIALTQAICEGLNRFNIAFLHVMRADFFQAQQGDVLGTARKYFKNAIVTNMGYTGEEAEAAVASKAVDAVAFGTKFLANPDLPERIRTKAALNDMRPQFFYANGAEGYTDYPALSN